MPAEEKMQVQMQSEADAKMVDLPAEGEATEINIDEAPNTPTKYGVRGIPTMLLFKDGELKSTKVGATPKSDIVSWIKENI